MSTSCRRPGRRSRGVAPSATLHCLTGCAIGEIAGMAIGTALGFSDWGTVALAVVLAFVFGYSLTSLPLLRAGMAFGAVVPIALASDTSLIGVMEIVDNSDRGRHPRARSRRDSATGCSRDRSPFALVDRGLLSRCPSTAG